MICFPSAHERVWWSKWHNLWSQIISYQAVLSIESCYFPIILIKFLKKEIYPSTMTMVTMKWLTSGKIHRDLRIIKILLLSLWQNLKEINLCWSFSCLNTSEIYHSWDTMSTFSQFYTSKCLWYWRQNFKEIRASFRYIAFPSRWKHTIVIYNVKVEKDSTIILKAHIDSHGNDYSNKMEMHSDCSMCDPTGGRILLSTATIKNWRVSSINVYIPFLKTGPTHREYVIPWKERYDTRELLLLLKASYYGLVNSNANWKL